MDHIYGLTVQGIQSYIFATNNLREIIGGSELIESICTTRFDEFLSKNKITGDKLLNAAGNIRFRTDETSAKLILKEYNSILQEEAPGVPFSQAVVKIKNFSSAIDELDRALRAQRNIPVYNFDLGNMGRMMARTTGDAAVDITNLKSPYTKQKRKSLDQVNYKKFDLGENPLCIKKKLNAKDLKFAKNFENISRGAKHSWLALVHIDGNGMGKIIQKILAKGGEEVFDRLKSFSDNVEKATIEAFKEALQRVIKQESQAKELPFRPLILGGDDVTAIMRADLALDFVELYLSKFEEFTLKYLVDYKDITSGLTACAGIAFVKDKFPFHYSAELAEELCSFAKKKSGRKASSVMFHRVQDSFIGDFDEIITREMTSGNRQLVNGPYYLANSDEKEKIRNLKTQIRLLRDEDSPKNAMREWLDLALSDSPLTATFKERMGAKFKSKYSGIIQKEEAYIDYLTLLAIAE